MINTNISDHTLALFGKSTDQSGDKPTIKTDGLDQATNAAKYAPTTSTSPAAPTDEGPRDAASSYRPKLDVEMPGHYADPRAASGTGTERAAPAYDGPSYTERAAGGSLLETVMADLEAIKNNQLADMQAQHTAVVEAALGRSLAEGEQSSDFNTNAILANEDWSLGRDMSGLGQVLRGASNSEIYDSADIHSKGVVSKEYFENTTEDQRIDDHLNSIVDNQLNDMQKAIRSANDAVRAGYETGQDYLPDLSEEEMNQMRGELLSRHEEAYAAGKLTISFDVV